MSRSPLAQYILSEQDEIAGRYLRDLAQGSIDVLLVLGSGLAETLDNASAWGTPVGVVALSDIPGVVAPVADGHLDEFRVYRRSGLTVGVALGRTHVYEGLGSQPVSALPRAAVCAGVSTAILCNANGCLRDWELGDVMAVEDHANFTGMSPFNGPVFIDTTRCWNAELTAAMSATCERRGTYALMRGPEYQTLTETRLLAAAGVDCVGMSTVIEALTLHALGVQVCGMSVVSDLSFAATATDPTAVVAAAAQAQITIADTLEILLDHPLVKN